MKTASTTANNPLPNMQTPQKQTSASHAAQIIWSHWQSGQALKQLPEECRPMTVQQGYEAQAQLPVVSGRHLVGWKIAATRAAKDVPMQVNTGKPAHKASLAVVCAL